MLQLRSQDNIWPPLIHTPPLQWLPSTGQTRTLFLVSYLKSYNSKQHHLLQEIQGKSLDTTDQANWTSSVVSFDFNNRSLNTWFSRPNDKIPNLLIRISGYKTDFCTQVLHGEIQLESTTNCCQQSKRPKEKIMPLLQRPHFPSPTGHVLRPPRLLLQEASSFPRESLRRSPEKRITKRNRRESSASKYKGEKQRCY